DIQEQPANQVRVLVVLLEIKAAGAPINLPVDVLDIVAGNIFAVLGELDGEAVVGTFVHAGEIALHDKASLQLQAMDFGQRQRIKIALGVHGVVVSCQCSVFSCELPVGVDRFAFLTTEN